MMRKALYVTAFAACIGLGTAQYVQAATATVSETEDNASVSPLPVAKPESASPESAAPSVISPSVISPSVASPESYGLGVSGPEVYAPAATGAAPASAEPVSSEPASSETLANEVLQLELHLSERRLAVYRGDMLVANYSVAVGREGWQTPTGEFSVFQKQRNPAWEHPFTGEVIPPGPENPLGTRWIGFWSDGENSIGFHGTPDESVIGSAVSHGCVRMRNEDVLALYEQVSVDTLVTVLP